MPLYSYRCPAEHETTVLCRYDARPATTPCETCAAPAVERPAAPAATMGCKPPVDDSGPTVRVKGGTGYRCPTFQCDACAHQWFDAFTDDEPDPTTCPKCGAGGIHQILTLGGEYNNRLYGTGGYFDRGLNMWIRSEKQRRAEAEKRGLAYDLTDDDLRRAQAKKKADEAAEQAEYDRYIAGLRRDPDMLRARDQGLIRF